MTKLKWRQQTLIIPVILIVASEALAQLPDFPQDFAEKAFVHVEKLSSFGFRRAGSTAENRTVNYLIDHFGSLGLETQIDTFSYKAYEASDIVVEVNGDRQDNERIWINPYENTEFKGVGIVFGSDSSYQSFSQKDIAGKIILASDKANPYKLIFKTPKALVVLPDSILQTYDPTDLEVKVVLTGKTLNHKSVNVIADYKTQSDKEIIISAHWDSFNGPGAADNASGLSVLLELARYFTDIKLPYSIKFVAFGAEELGKLGSKAFVIKHQDELGNYKFLFNIDGVGGHKDIYIEGRGGIRNSPEVGNFKFDVESAFYAKTDFNNNWYHIKSEPSVSNVPDWLIESIDESCRELGYEYIKANEMGSDHQVFFMSGVPATNICFYGDNKTHCPEDIPEQINLDGLEKSGEIVALTIRNVISKEINFR